jgi:hypothetical protein
MDSDGVGTSFSDGQGLDTMNKRQDGRHLKDAKRQVPAGRGAKKVSEPELQLAKPAPPNPFPDEPWHGWPPQTWNGKKWVYLK